MEENPIALKDRLALLECRVGALEHNLTLTETLSRMGDEQALKGFRGVTSGMIEIIKKFEEMERKINNLKEGLHKK